MKDTALVPDRKVSGRELRRRLNSNQEWMAEQVAPSVNQLLTNEKVTIAKITALEGWLTTWQTMTFWQRVRWIVRGAK